jgi:hypothetical protein
LRIFKVVWILFPLILSDVVQADTVKLSRNFICHDETSPSYYRTKNFIPYQNIEDCIGTGGRLPKNRIRSKDHSQKYDRRSFNHWIDEDGDCLNTRHEVLLKQSALPVSFKTACIIEGGLWKDLYSGEQFTSAKNLQIDHLVPLKWAWDHGANNWTAKKRKLFANDEANLFTVNASVNNEKGTMGPTLWLPPETQFHCDYLTQFVMILESYKLILTSNEHDIIYRMKIDKCLPDL